MPGLRVFRSLRPPFVARGEDRAVARQDSARCVADASPRSGARLLAARYDAIHSHEEGGLIGIVLAALLRVPHLYDMHSSLPQQLTNFAFTRSTMHPARVPGRSSADDPALAGRHRDLPVARRDGPRDRSGGAGGAHRKRARLGGGAGDRGAGGGGARRSSASPPATPLVLYTGTFEAYQGLDLLFAAMAARAAGAARRPAAAGRRQARSGGAGAGAGARAAGIGDVTIFAGERPGGRDPGVSARVPMSWCRLAREGTNTPLKIYQYLRSGKADRRDAAAHAHAGARATTPRS